MVLNSLTQSLPGRPVVHVRARKLFHLRPRDPVLLPMVPSHHPWSGTNVSLCFFCPFTSWSMMGKLIHNSCVPVKVSQPKLQCGQVSHLLGLGMRKRKGQAGGGEKLSSLPTSPTRVIGLLRRKKLPSPITAVLATCSLCPCHSGLQSRT